MLIFTTCRIYKKLLILQLIAKVHSVTMGCTSPLKNFLPSVEKSVEHTVNYCTSNWSPSEKSSLHSCIPSWLQACYYSIALHEMIYGLLCCYYYKFKGPRSGSDEA